MELECFVDYYRSDKQLWRYVLVVCKSPIVSPRLLLSFQSANETSIFDIKRVKRG
jgi:hypothetical protein